jgi:outer membrane lipoprotein-sorting protein
MKAHTAFLLILVSMPVLLVSGPVQEGTGEYIPVKDLGELVDRLNRQAAGIETIESDFIQKKQLEFLDETIVSRGKFWFRRENSLRWEYTEPFEYTIVIHQGKFRIMDGDRVSDYDIESNAVFREINDLIIGMVRGTVMEEDKFEIEAWENRYAYLLRLVPKDSQMREVINEMKIRFSKTDLMVSEIVMTESATDHTVITFIDRRANESIPDAVFDTVH